MEATIPQNLSGWGFVIEGSGENAVHRHCGKYHGLTELAGGRPNRTITAPVVWKRNGEDEPRSVKPVTGEAVYRLVKLVSRSAG